MTSRPSTAARYLTLALAVFALIVPMGAYVGGYFWLGKYTELDLSDSAFPSSLTAIERSYPQQWMKIAFRPAARFEGWLRGVLVVVTSSREDERTP